MDYSTIVLRPPFPIPPGIIKYSVFLKHYARNDIIYLNFIPPDFKLFKKLFLKKKKIFKK